MKNTKFIHAIWAMILFSLIAISPISRVNAQPYFSVYPTEGTVKTDIFLQVRGLPGSGFYEVYYLYIFWDHALLGLFPDNSQTYDHYFDTHFYPLNNGSYSSLGNHTVYFEVWNYHRNAMFINATFVFTITQYLPNAEYLALNATYYSLLDNYTALNATYLNLQSQYDALTNDYNSLLATHNTLLAQYDSLLSNYDSLSSSYNALSSNYNSLLNSYSSLSSNYNNLQGNYNSLSSDYSDLGSQYDALKVDYALLKTSFTSLDANYETLVGDLAAARNLNYVLIVTTIVSIALAIYLIAKKKKPA